MGAFAPLIGEETAFVVILSGAFSRLFKGRGRLLAALGVTTWDWVGAKRRISCFLVAAGRRTKVHREQETLVSNDILTNLA
jgi:hypothetical protein